MRRQFSITKIRKKFFNLPSGLTSVWETLRTDETKISFLLQLGYFRARQRLFAGHFHPVDLRYISAKFYLSSGNQEIPSYSRPGFRRLCPKAGINRISRMTVRKNIFILNIYLILFGSQRPFRHLQELYRK